MLVLSRKVGERLVIGEDIVLVVNKVAGNRVVIAIDAPSSVRIVRGELAPLTGSQSASTDTPDAVTLAIESRASVKSNGHPSALPPARLRAACG